jgi:geranyl-CoA carboxylase alpha subunit
MGDKAAAKALMAEAGMPVPRGWFGEQDDALMISQAAETGFPLIIKVVAGGGGRGICIIHDETQLPAAIASAHSEAANAFGCGNLMMEWFIKSAHHVEIQVFADAHGQVVHLFEWDCSLQRRRQKIMEEAPSLVMTAEIHEVMGAAAVQAAQAISYVRARTVEFLLDSQGGFFFLEMNTRLQVEHSVTELITGQDLVHWQLLVVMGQALPLSQEEISLQGHAMEAQIYAENPAAGFLPCTRPALLWQPCQGRGVRIDSGISQGQEISSFYDPMITKIVIWGETENLLIIG